MHQNCDDNFHTTHYFHVLLGQKTAKMNLLKIIVFDTMHNA
ncbi:hypothetical protein HMPREF0555_0265 [Leuconostoc mesenteroides subsp. cremoris ATCC 19254]|uniref:Uncharacterized protein n=1 Tax=Leuconostoc mesenteroides subsp. cremoris ATCC 19254 TaxID=586220 RepID=C2KHZ9_LEUMC|nr:hypothetical protein HMPREF0555_0265 [Leuconostoc mesenteroides subsp. cremoris ATCC 19254]